MTTFKLSAVQIDLMRVLWKSGQASTSEIHKAVQAKRKLAYTSVATMLKRLEKRGVIAQSQSGRELVFTPLIDEAQVKRSMVSSLLNELFNDAPEELVAHLVQESEIDHQDLGKIRQLIEAAEKKE